MPLVVPFAVAQRPTVAAFAEAFATCAQVVVGEVVTLTSVVAVAPGWDAATTNADPSIEVTFPLVPRPPPAVPLGAPDGADPAGAPEGAPDGRSPPVPPMNPVHAPSTAGLSVTDDAATVVPADALVPAVRTVAHSPVFSAAAVATFVSVKVVLSV